MDFQTLPKCPGTFDCLNFVNVGPENIRGDQFSFQTMIHSILKNVVGFLP